MRHPTEDRAFRLDPGVRPLRYQATLSVDLAGRSFRGEARVDVSLAAPARELVLHALGLELTGARVRAGGRALSAEPGPSAESQSQASRRPAFFPLRTVVRSRMARASTSPMPVSIRSARSTSASIW